MLSHQAQPFVYAGYTIFRRRSAVTLSEALFLDFMLERAKTREERAVLLQHCDRQHHQHVYTQVMFADFELQAHRLVEQDQPVTSDVLNGLLRADVRDYYGDVIDEEELSRVTWARIPHFFSTPYYVYQYATCFRVDRSADAGHSRDRTAAARASAVERYLALLRAGGSDYPMNRRCAAERPRQSTV
jgi:oligoendopeptidase F